MTKQPSILACLVLCAPLVACTGSNAKEPKDPTKVDKDHKQQVEKLDRITITAYSTEELLKDFERARSYLLVDKFAKAARAFDRLMRLAKDPRIKALALFNSGVAYEGLGQRDKAIVRYREMAKKHAGESITGNGLVRLTRLLGYLERWEELEKTSSDLLARKDLPVMMKIEGYGARALSHVERGQIVKATIAVAKATVLIDKHGFGRSGRPPVQLAQVSFAEGEIRRLDSEKIKLTVKDENGNASVPPNFGALLELRCQGLLDAQRAYTEAMRTRDSHWSAMSGYRVGQLYQQLHREVMSIPMSKKAKTTKQKQLFEAAMRMRYRILLEKGLRMMNGTVRIGERTGEASYWIARARDAKRVLEQSLEDEKAAMGKLPYTEAEILLALEKLKAMKKKPAAKKP